MKTQQIFFIRIQIYFVYYIFSAKKFFSTALPALKTVFTFPAVDW